MANTTDPATLVDRLNQDYCRLHTAKEDAFWRSYMGLGDDSARDQEDFNRCELELQAWLQDPGSRIVFL